VRVDIRLLEVNRTKLRSWRSNLATAIGSQRIGPIAQGSAGQTVGAPRVGPGNSIENVVGFLAGALVNETQATAGRFALDSIISYLEQQGIVRTLSSPSLTVLSGEQADFQVGGQVPLATAFSPAFGGAGAAGTNQGIFSSVVFQSFGISLDIRPLVGDDDTITLDVAPQITQPDAGLTSTIRQTSGTNLNSTAFSARSLNTSARLQDGQSLLLGGLLSRNASDNQTSTPGLRDVPGLGWLFKNADHSDDSTELIVVVNPVIVRDPLPNVRLWEYPTSSELMDKFGRGAFEAPLGGGVAAPVRP
jgi:pilus assembly protein CpaC